MASPVNPQITSHKICLYMFKFITNTKLTLAFLCVIMGIVRQNSTLLSFKLCDLGKSLNYRKYQVLNL